MNEAYRKGCAEAYFVIQRLDPSERQKVPQKYMDFLAQNKLDISLDAANELSEEGRTILSIVYRLFLGAEEEKKEKQLRYHKNLLIEQIRLLSKTEDKSKFSNVKDFIQAIETLEEISLILKMVGDEFVIHDYLPIWSIALDSRSFSEEEQASIPIQHFKNCLLDFMDTFPTKYSDFSQVEDFINRTKNIEELLLVSNVLGQKSFIKKSLELDESFIQLFM